MNAKQQAAISAVMCLLRQEEEQKSAVSYSKPAIYPSPWALQSRQTIMQNRSLVQRRLVKR